MTIETSSTTMPANYRRGVGVTLLNDKGGVFVARRIDFPDGAWQMPQGGIDEGELPHETAFRELREEIGTDSAEILAESAGWYRYDLPEEVLRRWGRGPWRGQEQKWFVMRFKGDDSDIDLATEHPEFSDWKWASVRELPEMVVSFKRQVYVDLLSEFPEIEGAMASLSRLLADPLIQKVMIADKEQEREIFDLLRPALPR